MIKTHTPLDGLPHDARAIAALIGRGDAEAPARRPPLRERLREWIGGDDEPVRALDSLPGVLRHIAGAWAQRHEPRVVLVHYADLLADLDGQMRRLARLLGTAPPGEGWPAPPASRPRTCSPGSTADGGAGPAAFISCMLAFRI